MAMLPTKGIQLGRSHYGIPPSPAARPLIQHNLPAYDVLRVHSYIFATALTLTLALLGGLWSSRFAHGDVDSSTPWQPLCSQRFAYIDIGCRISRYLNYHQIEESWAICQMLALRLVK